MPKTSEAVAVEEAKSIDAAPGMLIDDLPNDPVTPAAALAPLPEPTPQQLLDGLRSLARVVDAAMDRLPKALEELLGNLVLGLTPSQNSLSPPEAGALQHLVDTLETLGARGLMITKPYTATLTVKTPSGYSAALTIERTDGKEFFAALAGMESWLVGNKYVPLA